MRISIRLLFGLGLALMVSPTQAQSREQLRLLSNTLLTPRSTHTATLLSDGTVLIAGGMTDGENFLESAELFDPATGLFSPTGSLTEPRSTHAAVLLQNSKVLMIGGYGRGRLATTEIYDPLTHTFSPSATMHAPREGFTTTLLHNGQVLVAGGYGRTYRESLSSAELYDPQTDTFIQVGSMHTARASFTATLLNDGRVLVIGGRLGNQLVDSAELYDPTTRQFSPAGTLQLARHKHATSILPNGDVLVIGGATIETRGVDGQLDSLEVYHVQSGLFSILSPMQEARYKILDAVTTFADGRIVIAGAGRTVEIYDPQQNALLPAQGSLGRELFYMTTTRLANGSILLLGGYDGNLRVTDKAWLLYTAPDHQ